MPLSVKEIEGLVRLIGLTRDEEIDCDQCLSLVAAFAERELADRTREDGLQAVEQHLLICEECREEYEALQQALKKLDD